MKLSSLKKLVTKMCTPAKVYLVIAVLSNIAYIYHMLRTSDEMVEIGGQSLHEYTLWGLASNVGFLALWTLLLNYVCKRFKNGETIAWILLFIPVLFFAFVVIMVIYTLSHVVSNGRIIGDNQTQMKRDQDMLKTSQGEMVDHQDQLESTLSTMNPAVVKSEPIPTSQMAGYSWQGQQNHHAIA